MTETTSTPTASEALAELVWLDQLETEYSERGEDLPPLLLHRHLQLHKHRAVLQQRVFAEALIEAAAQIANLLGHLTPRNNADRRRWNKARAIQEHRARKLLRTNAAVTNDAALA